jgi:tRNA pseudouridine38-40 synthase
VNYKLTLQYDGTDFHGWQIQTGFRTIQGELTAALSLLEGSEPIVHGSGRTDAGVHAEGQVANVQLERPFTSEKLRAAINANVGKDLRVMDVAQVDDDFHARYSAIGKTYVYRVINGPVASPFWARYALREARFLDLKRMREVAKLFHGKHDWTAFSAAQSDVEDRVRTISELTLEVLQEPRARETLIEIRVSADGFLRYMVRAIAGTLLAVGRGELDEDAVCDAIENGNRPLEAVTAPSHGLTLLEVRYK